ncbi:hypothetical protein A8B82_19045 [Sulfitobacter sp. EhC04]|uniref:PAS domain-containing protein n=1 Tax=Sulfitobacter sp. EhC04 TaxID=1849168 RepID=UPI0007F3FF64|nr:PAS domain-containing protein [Sulfitobacter sp. EhC04]OAN73613.1 hypothetical protein A8B82_19045 [Sulfitobacter sp. EhC04]
MFTTANVRDLRRQIDRFNVPMFIIQRYRDTHTFEILALNRRYEVESGMSMDAIQGKPLTDLLPPKQAAAVGEKYEKCLTEKAPQRYREVLDLPRGSMIWDTTLQYAEIAGQPDRIIGSAIVLERIEHDDHDEHAFQDMRYLAAASGCELGKVSALLEAVERGHFDSKRLAGSAGMLAGLCRTIDYKLNEIRAAAEKRINDRAARALGPARVHLIETPTSHNHNADEVDAAIAALVDLIGTMPDHEVLPSQQATANN